jgi:hypothetical protein
MSSFRALVAVLPLVAAACFGSNDEESASGSSGAPDAGEAPMGNAECRARCQRHADTCANGDDCGARCAGPVSRAAIRCVEALDCQAPPSAADACVRDNPESGALERGAFGDDCACDGDEVECRSTCADGLSCIVHEEARVCAGPECCTAAACDELLGTAADCGEGRVCGCADGTDTCDRGLCVADH